MFSFAGISLLLHTIAATAEAFVILQNELSHAVFCT